MLNIFLQYRFVRDFMDTFLCFYANKKNSYVCDSNHSGLIFIYTKDINYRLRFIYIYMCVCVYKLFSLYLQIKSMFCVSFMFKMIQANWSCYWLVCLITQLHSFDWYNDDAITTYHIFWISKWHHYHLILNIVSLHVE